jgi:hypothetical protein
MASAVAAFGKIVAVGQFPIDVRSIGCHSSFTFPIQIVVVDAEHKL